MCTVRPIAFLTLLAGAALLASGCGDGEPDEAGGGSIFVCCAGGVKAPVTELARAFERETGIVVELTYANSGVLLGQITTTGKGDVYVPGDVGFVEQAAERGLTRGQPRTLCYFIPVLLVGKGNPKSVRALSDLARPGLRVALAAEGAALGKAQARLFEKNSIDVAAVKKNLGPTPATVGEVAMTVKMGTVDAAIVWDAFGSLYPERTEAVPIPVEQNIVRTVTATALAGARNPEASEAFVNFLASEAGKKVLREHHYTVEPPR